MVLDAETRKKNLSKMRENAEPSGKEKLWYKGKTDEFDVYRIDLDNLVYNRHNGRIEAEMLTWEQEHSVSYDEYDAELHARIGDFLWESNPTRNKATLKDLDKKGQQKSGIVSLDGVVIDGNRRSMLLRRLGGEKQKQYLNAIILPDGYDDNQADIVRMETQYQLGEDSKVEYGAIQKYLHARRLHVDLSIPLPEIDELMNEKPGNAQRLLDIMELMEEYLEHISCPRLYLMLKDGDGTKEGMFVDLYQDLKRLESGNAKIEWAFDPDIDPLQLKLIQFDFMRLGDFSDAKKVYRNISHSSKGKNFFANKEIWEAFRDRHTEEVEPINALAPLATLQEYMVANPNFESKMDAARARDADWSQRAKGPMTGNFNRADYNLDLAKEEREPEEYLRRARDQLQKIDLNNEALFAEETNRQLVIEINKMVWDIKKNFDRKGRS